MKIEQFKTAFTDSLMYADLATEYTSFEIFEINNGKFELEAVQQAYQNWSKQNTVDEKRAHFAKDLDKLVSGDYVLVPRNPTARMMDVGSAAHFEHNTVGDIYRSMINVAQEQVSNG